MKTVFTGWRNVTPGNCDACGFDSDWQCDGSGAITCDCQLSFDSDMPGHVDYHGNGGYDE